MAPLLSSKRLTSCSAGVSVVTLPSASETRDSRATPSSSVERVSRLRPSLLQRQYSSGSRLEALAKVATARGASPAPALPARAAWAAAALSNSHSVASRLPLARLPRMVATAKLAPSAE